MKSISIFVVCVCLLMLTCSNTTQNTVESVESVAVDSLEDDTLSVEELPLPVVPTALVEPEARASYVIAHFWDAMDFGDIVRSHSSAFMEQNFVNFVSVFPYADEESRRSAVSSLLGMAAVDAGAYRLLSSIAEDYLYDPNSPMFDEETYILFLESMVRSSILDEAHITRLNYQLRFARLNRPGMRASDFSYVMSNGKQSRLHKTDTANRLLLVFYDPDCDHCKEVMAELKVSSLIAELVAGGSIRVLAIYADGDKDLWESTCMELPDSWTVGMDTKGEIYERGLYSLRALPSIYLLDKDKTVILKDVSLNSLFDYLESM